MTYDINNLDKFDERFKDYFIIKTGLLKDHKAVVKSFILQDRQEAYNAGRQSGIEEVLLKYKEAFEKAGLNFDGTLTN
jgi:hypothetical protein